MATAPSEMSDESKRLYERGMTYLNNEDVKRVLSYMKTVGVGKYVTRGKIAGDPFNLRMNEIGLLKRDFDVETREFQYALTQFGLQVAEKPENFYEAVGRKLAETDFISRGPKSHRDRHRR